MLDDFFLFIVVLVKNYLIHVADEKYHVSHEINWSAQKLIKHYIYQKKKKESKLCIQGCELGINEMYEIFWNIGV